jgi:hypothetical protein
MLVTYIYKLKASSKFLLFTIYNGIPVSYSNMNGYHMVSEKTTILESLSLI